MLLSHMVQFKISNIYHTASLSCFIGRNWTERCHILWLKFESWLNLMSFYHYWNHNVWLKVYLSFIWSSNCQGDMKQGELWSTTWISSFDTSGEVNVNTGWKFTKWSPMIYLVGPNIYPKPRIKVALKVSTQSCRLD